jgi:hypothetical protein
VAPALSKLACVNRQETGRFSDSSRDHSKSSRAQIKECVSPFPLAQRGIEVSYETTRCQTIKFGPQIARNLDRSGTSLSRHKLSVAI